LKIGKEITLNGTIKYCHDLTFILKAKLIQPFSSPFYLWSKVMKAQSLALFGPSSISTLEIFLPLLQFDYSRICFFTTLKSAVFLLLEAIAFLFTNPILSRNDCAQSLLIRMWFLL